MPLFICATGAQQGSRPGLSADSGNPSFHPYGFSSTWDLCSQALYPQLSPQALFCQVCVSALACICVYVRPSSPLQLLLASTTTGQVPGVTILCQAGVSSEKQRGCRAPYSGCGNYLSLGFSLMEQAAWGTFPLLGPSDRACWSGVEKQKPTLPLHPSLRRKRQAREVAGIRRLALEEQQRVGWRVGGQSTPSSPLHTETQVGQCTMGWSSVWRTASNPLGLAEAGVEN